MRRAARSWEFWMLAGTFFICGATSNGVVGQHFIAHAVDHGFTPITASGALAVMGAFNFVGTIASGWLTDRVDPRKLLLVYYTFRGLSLLYLPAIHDNVDMVGFAVLFGLDYIATVPPTVALVADTFGRRNVGIVYGWVYFAHMFGAAILAVVAGLIRDNVGDLHGGVRVRRLAGRGGRPRGAGDQAAGPARRRRRRAGHGRRVTARKKPPLGQTIGGVLFGFEQQVFRNQPPPHELVHHARPDSAVAAGDGSLLTIELPDDADRRTTMTDAQIRELTEQPTVAVRVRQPMSETDMGAAVRPLPAADRRSPGREPASRPPGRRSAATTVGTDEVDVEIGIPVAAPPAGVPALDATSIPASPARRRCPAGSAAVDDARGPYTRLPATYERAPRLDPRPGPRGGRRAVGGVRRRSRGRGPGDAPDRGRVAGPLTAIR